MWSTQQPILLHGHERSITAVKYNLDGDLLFTSAKDNKPTVWYADTGERLGTYGSIVFTTLIYSYENSYDDLLL